jgi:hypothetical protein
MRRCFLLILMLGLAPAGLPAQTATPPAQTSDSSFSDFPITAGNFSSSTPANDLLLAPALNPGSAPESRTPAQLQAVLAAYVGHWQGNYTITSTAGVELNSFPIDVVYSMEKDPGGRSVLVANTHLTEDGKPVTQQTRSWVENDQILAEVINGDSVEKFFARPRDADLVWFTHDPDKDQTDFSMTETLKLTADGGTLISTGFERVPQSDPPVLVLVTSSLIKLPK